MGSDPSLTPPPATRLSVVAPPVAVARLRDLRAGAALFAALLLPAGPATGTAAAQTRQTPHTVRLEEGAPRPAASVSELAWLAGRWVGEGLGATVEEVWLPPAGDAMTGVFRLVRDGKVEFYEIVILAEEEGSLTLRLKHFDADLTGWEAKDEVASFPLVRREEDALWFDGLTLWRRGEDRMEVWVALESEGEEVREALFEYRRVR